MGISVYVDGLGLPVVGMAILSKKLVSNLMKKTKNYQ